MTEVPDQPLTPDQIEGRMRSALAAIAAGWDHMLTTPPTARPGQRVDGTGATLADTDERDDDMPRLVRVMDDRAAITDTLNGWCRVVVEDYDVEHGIPSGADVPGMCDFLTRWSHLMAEHEAALDLLDELARCRGQVTRWCPPTQHPPAGWAPRPRTMRLGACPLTWQHPETADDQPCPGTLRGREDGWVTCDTCGAQAVLSWWEKEIYGEGGVPPMTLDEVRLYLHRHHGTRLTTRGLRVWVRDGDLVPVDSTPGVTHRYDVATVERARTRRAARRVSA